MSIDTTVVLCLGIVQLALALFGALIGWLVKGIFDRMKSLEEANREMAKQMAELRVSLAERYVSKADHTKALDDIFTMLRRIEDKLDHKADKP